MSQHSLPALNQFKNINLSKNSNNLILSFNEPSNSDPSTVFSSPEIQLDFEPVYVVKFCLLLLISLIVPLLSLHSSFLSVLGYRKSNSQRAYRHRTSRRKLPVNYEPPQSIVDAPFIPLPTRRHFRLSHVGNRNLNKSNNVVYTNQSSSDSEDNESEHDPFSDREQTERFRLIFGKRLRGEEEEFKGRSAMKGSRLSASPFHSSSSRITTNLSPSILITTDSNHFTQLSVDENASQAGFIPSKTYTVSPKAISFAPVHLPASPTKLTFL